MDKIEIKITGQEVINNETYQEIISKICTLEKLNLEPKYLILSPEYARKINAIKYEGYITMFYGLPVTIQNVDKFLVGV
jgi:hypothetical protein